MQTTYGAGSWRIQPKRSTISALSANYCQVIFIISRFSMNKLLVTVVTFCTMLFAAGVFAAEEAPARDRSYFFPPEMQSLPLYGDAAIPNSKPAADEETGAGTGWIQKVSQPYIQVYLPAKVKATGASVVIFPGGAYWGLTFENEGIQQARYFVDHGIAAFVVKYRLPSDVWMKDRSIG